MSLRSLTGSSLLAVILMAGLSETAQAQVRVVSYNMHGYIGSNFAYHEPLQPYWVGTESNPGLLRLIGSETVNGIAIAPTVMSLQEVYHTSTDGAKIAGWLNTIYGSQGANYQSSQQTAGGSEDYAFVYDASKVTLVDIKPVYTPTRTSWRAHFQLNGYTSTGSDFYVYDMHWKAYAGYESTRTATAWDIRDNADILPANSNVIYTGDYNTTTISYYSNGTADISGEPALAAMFSAGNNQAVDPASYARKYLSYSSSGFYSRIDYQLVGKGLVDGNGMDIVGTPGNYSYWSQGNNGVDDYAIQSVLRSASDHVPVVADYQLPAKMSVTVASAPSRVIVGASASVGVTVSNSANVVAANGADELNYTVTGSGVASANISGTDYALGTGNTHVISLNTTSAGHKTGTIGVTSSSYAVQDGTFNQAVAIDVVDHSRGSFNSTSQQKQTSYDFGWIWVDSSDKSQSFNLYNLVTTAGYTADLDLDQITVTGNTSSFSTNLTTFAGMDAGTSQGFTIQLLSDFAGSFQVVYKFNVSDENLSGATSDQLQLTVSGTVRLQGDYNGDGSVTLADYTVWADAFGSSLRDADGNSDGVVTLADYTIWSDHLGQTLSSHETLVSTVVIPEPASMGLLMIGTIALAARRRRVH